MCIRDRSTAIPIVIAAIVIVIISNGISNNPIIPNIKNAAIKFGTTPISESLIFLNKIRNIIKQLSIDISGSLVKTLELSTSFSLFRCKYNSMTCIQADKEVAKARKA